MKQNSGGIKMSEWYCKVSSHVTHKVKTKYEKGEVLIENVELHYGEQIFGPPYPSGRAVNKQGAGKSARFSFPGYAGKATLGFKLEEEKSGLDKVSVYLVVDLYPLYEKYHQTHEAFNFLSGNLASDGHYKPYAGQFMQYIAGSIGTDHVDFSKQLGLDCLVESFTFKENDYVVKSIPLTEKKDAKSDLAKKVFEWEGIKIIEPPEVEKLEEKAKLPFVTKSGLKTHPISVEWSFNQGYIENEAIKKLILEKYVTD